MFNKRRRLRFKKIKRLNDSEITKEVKITKELSDTVSLNITNGYTQRFLEYYNKGEWICCGFV